MDICHLAANSISMATMMGWVVFVGYLVTALLSGLCMRAAVRAAEPGIGVRTWGLMVGFLLAMAFNKQLDLHRGVWEWAKEVAKAQSWAEHKFTVHLIFVGCLGVVGLIIAIGLRHVLADAWRQHRPALFGVLALVAAVVLRLMTLPAFGKWFGFRLQWNLNWTLELVGLALIAWSAVRCIANAGNGDGDGSASFSGHEGIAVNDGP